MSLKNEIISKVLLTTEQYKGSFAAFRTAVLQNEYTSTNPNFSRLLIWKLCFLTETLNIPSWELKLLASRAVYQLLRSNPEMNVPWHKLDKDNEFYQPNASKLIPNTVAHPLTRIHDVQDDPLSAKTAPDDLQKKNNPVQTDSELLDAIILDVQRLFPGEDYFHNGLDAAFAAKRQLITILYIWCKCNPTVGYKQGIHEILGLIYLNMIKESVSLTNTTDCTADDMMILSLYNLQYLEHDLFALFNRFVVSSGIVAAFYETEQLLMRSIESFNGLLMKVDQLVHYNLITKLRLDTPLWIIRFLRLLLLRELSNDLEVASLLWDKLVAAELEKPIGQTCLSDMIICMIVVMLVHLKTELMLCDFSEALSLLLHYPITTKMTVYPDFMNLLFRDAHNLHALRDKDLKLYEYGIKLNKMYNSKIKVNFGASNGSTPSSPGVLSPKASLEMPSKADTRAAKLKFEKNRLEMRLKKRAQEMINQ
ncbi:hypothetical protein PUMCH_004830 [Australozyma saopauloensis]|uniref:Rab-GAP TBC domain-containing protein n=1 Tax=Australozyma saopauloensis TaxID=291208 RepID=A0AAX4HFQ0_9ASCO|nr:hypothetical protein PUMCH_004830 [[Candida] saopauloensis]